MWINPYLPVENESEFPRFCGKCGREMVNDDHLGGYDRTTGQRLSLRAVRCPKGRWDQKHEAYLVAPRPGPVPMPPR